MSTLINAIEAKNIDSKTMTTEARWTALLGDVSGWPVVTKGLSESVLDGEGVLVLNSAHEEINLDALAGTGLDPQFEGKFRVPLGGQLVPVKVRPLTKDWAEIITDSNGHPFWSFRLSNQFSRLMLSDKTFKPSMKKTVHMDQFFRAASGATSAIFEDGFRKRKTGTLGFQWVCGASSVAGYREIILDIEVAYALLCRMGNALAKGSELRGEWASLLKKYGGRIGKLNPNKPRSEMKEVATLLNETRILIQRHPTTGANGAVEVRLTVADLEAPFVVMNHETAKALLGDFDGDGYFFSFGSQILTVGEAVTRILETEKMGGHTIRLVEPYAKLELKDTNFGLSNVFFEGHFEGEAGQSVIPFSSVLGGEAKISVGLFKYNLYWIMEGLYQAACPAARAVEIAGKVLLSPHWGVEVPESIKGLAEFQKGKPWGDSADKGDNRKAVWDAYVKFAKNKTWENLAALKKATWYSCYYGLEEFLMDAAKFKVKLKEAGIQVVPELMFDVVTFITEVSGGNADLSVLEKEGFCIYPLEEAMKNGFYPTASGVEWNPLEVLSTLRPHYTDLVVMKSTWQSIWHKKDNPVIHQRMAGSDMEAYWKEMVAPPVEWEHYVPDFRGTVKVGAPNFGYVPGEVKNHVTLSDIPTVDMKGKVVFEKRNENGEGPFIGVKARNGAMVWLELADDEMYLQYNGKSIVLDKIKLVKNTLGVEDPLGWLFVSRQGSEYFYNWRVVDQNALYGIKSAEVKLGKIHPLMWLGMLLHNWVTKTGAHHFTEREHTSIVLERVSKELRVKIMKLPRIRKGDNLAKAYLGEFVTVDTSYCGKKENLMIRRKMYMALERLGFDLRMTKHAERGDRLGRRINGWDALSGALLWPSLVNANRKSKLDSILVNRRSFSETDLDIWTNKFGDKAAKAITVALVSWDGFGSPDAPCDETYRTYHGDETLATSMIEYKPVSEEEYQDWLASNPDTELVAAAELKSVDVPSVHREGFHFRKRVIPISLPGVRRDARKLAIGYRPGINQPFPYDLVASHTQIKKGEDWRKRLTATGNKKVIMVDVLDSVWACLKKAACDQVFEMVNSQLDNPIKNTGQSAEQLISAARSEEAIRNYTGAKSSGTFDKASEHDDAVEEMKRRLKAEGKDPEGRMHLYALVDGELTYLGKAIVGTRVCYRPSYEQGWGSYGSICSTGVTMDLHMRVITGEGVTFTEAERNNYLFHQLQWLTLAACTDKSTLR